MGDAEPPSDDARGEAGSEDQAAKSEPQAESGTAGRKAGVEPPSAVEELDGSSSVADLRAEAEMLHAEALRRQQAAVKLRAEAALLREETAKLLAGPSVLRAEVTRLREAVQSARELIDPEVDAEGGAAEVQSQPDASTDPSPTPGRGPARRRWGRGRRSG